MSFVGHSIVIPLIDAELRYNDSIELGPGISIIRLSPQYRQRLQNDKALVGGYQTSIDRLSIGISLKPSISFQDKHFSLKDLLSLVIFLSFTLRLATEIPFDIPFWFDISAENNILGTGRTLKRTYGSLPRYLYPLDEGLTNDRLNSFLPHSLSHIERYIKYHVSDQLICAIEFAAIGFQTFHVPMRLVNQVVFMEILFSSDIHELSFQLASRISWYLTHLNSYEKREKIFDEVKEIYGMRSKIVHGKITKNAKSVRPKLRQALEKSESLNSEIFREILRRNHMELFSSKNREDHLRKLSLGLPSDFYEEN